MVSQPFCHGAAFLNHMLVDVHTDHAAAAVQHLMQVIVHHKAQIGLATGAVEQHDLIAVVLREHGGDQLDIVVDLIIFADHVVFQLAIRGQNADLAQQRRSLVDADEILPPAVEQRVCSSRLVLRRGGALSLFHLHPARGDRQGHYRAALGIDKHGLVKLLRLLSKKRTESSSIHRMAAALKTKLIPLLGARQRGGEFLFARGEGAVRLHEKIPVFIQPRRNSTQQQLELGKFAFLHLYHNLYRYMLPQIPRFGKPVCAKLQKTVPLQL